MSKNNRARRKEKQQARQRRQKQLQRREQQSFERWSEPVEFPGDADLRGDSTNILSAMEKRHRRSPKDAAVLLELIKEHQNQGNGERACVYAEQLMRVEPHATEWRLVLAEAYLRCAALNAACQEARTARARSPDDILVGEFAPIAKQLELAGQQAAIKMGFGDRDVVEELALHDRSMIYLAAGEFQLAIEVGEELLRRLPDFVRAWNNLSMAQFQAGHVRDAAQSLQQSLRLDSANVHALSNLTKIFFLEGKAEDAQRVFHELIAIPNTEPDHLVKKAEAAAWLGQDQFIVAACQEFDDSGEHQSPANEALLYHFGAVAQYRLGNEADARRWWKESLSLRPQFELAYTNLAAWNQEKLEFSPWYFDLNYWLRKDQLSAWLREWESSLKPEESMGARSRFVESHPEFQTLLPGLLDRGDKPGRDLALVIAIGSEAPAFHELLKRFATGQRGSVEQRMKAADYLASAGVFPAGQPVRFFSDGEWRNVLLLSYEITEEPNLNPGRSEEIQLLHEAAFENLQEENWSDAEKLLRSAVELEPNAPDLWNNLAMALDNSGQDREADEITQFLRSNFPTYFFGMLREASRAIDDGEFEHARELITQLAQKKKLHITEFRGLATVEIKLAMARNELESADSWLQLWRSVEDHPWQEAAEMRIEILRQRNQGRSMWTKANPFRRFR